MKMREESYMGMNEQEIQFVKNHIEHADDILNSKDYEGLLMALLDYMTFLLMDTDDVPDEVRFAEQIADQVVTAKRQDQHDQTF